MWSIKVWFVTLLLLNILDISTTSPSYEANPVTLYLWSEIGIFLSAWVKIGLILLFGALYVVAKKATAPHEWRFTREIFKAMLVILVAFYTFVVLVNLIVLSPISR